MLKSLGVRPAASPSPSCARTIGEWGALVGVELNGSWARRTSQADIAIVPIRDLCGPACQAAPRDAAHRLSVQRIAAGGSKFKLQLLELC